MEVAEFRRELTNVMRGFSGFSPMGILEGAGEEGYISNPDNELPPINIQDMIEAYFDALELREQFTNYEHLWMLEQIGLHKKLQEAFGPRHIKILSDRYLDMIPTNMSCRIFMMMLLMVLDQKLPDNKSFVAYLFKKAQETNNERLSQRDTLIDIVNVMTDLGAINHHDKSLKILITLSDQRDLGYVRDQVLGIASVYDEEIIGKLNEWLRTNENKGS